MDVSEQEVLALDHIDILLGDHVNPDRRLPQTGPRPERVW